MNLQALHAWASREIRAGRVNEDGTPRMPRKRRTWEDRVLAWLEREEPAASAGERTGEEQQP